MPGGLDLKAEVLNSDTCSLCGACLDWCPYLYNLDDHLIMRFDCNVQEGRCYSVCPRTLTDWEPIREQVLSNVPLSRELGPYTKIYKARTNALQEGQQDGGTVSSLLKAALQNQNVQAALLTGTNDGLTPVSFLGNDIEDIKKSAGSRFLASPGLRKIVAAQRQGIKSLAVVGRPCQVQALRKMEFNRPEAEPAIDMTVIGLFCMWSLSWEFSKYIAETYAGANIKKVTIPQHGLEIETDDGIKQVSTEKAREFIRSGCNYCLDMTSELADISVGSFELESGWNTVVVRSKKGEELLNSAVAEGYLSIEEYPQDELERLKSASYRKKMRGITALKGLQDRGGKSFIDLSGEHYRTILEDAEGEVKR